MTRLDKFLCDEGFGARKEVKALIKSGKVKVNGETAKSPETKIDDNAAVSVNGAEVKTQSSIYIIMNKPKGVVCASRDSLHKTVFDILPPEMKKKDLFTVGRLDIDTTGLLIITNDGDLSHRLLSPKHHAEKEYYVEGKGKFNPNSKEIFEEGLPWGKGRLKPARLEVISNDAENVKASLTITEGKFHQVKRMFYAVGIEVTELKRVRFGGLCLPPDIEEGEARYLTSDEEAVLKGKFELHTLLSEGLRDIAENRVQPFDKAMAEIKENL
ncbi:MAG: rRNA pseudouridine synthase [Clostridiales bacterium]|nr:rRNA pseudouridine synthase [Clostridiales bacterium]